MIQLAILVLFLTHISLSQTKLIIYLSKPAILIFVNSVIRPYLDFKTASRPTITTSIVHSKLDYCNSLYFLSLTYKILDTTQFLPRDAYT